MFTLDELKGLLNVMKMCESHKKVCEDIGMPLPVKALSDFYSLANRVVEEMQAAEKEVADKAKAKAKTDKKE